MSWIGPTAMLLDANVLLYSIDSSSRHHAPCAAWLSDAFSGSRRVGLPWQTIGAFLRISTHPRVFARPLRPDQAWEVVEQWLNAPNCWVPETSEATARILGALIGDLDLRGNLITDAQLAALALEHGVGVVSADTDFARFPGLRWVNPLTG
ncbi:MAG: type II toxin-antitoxin system VapC family toxin [Micropruina sp.]|uniref:type II toxin-antitoxin system VapC family toxin n=1 Tax=Micropruina sp. TaxID=2737536 RepID=UPI0039E39060